MGDAVGCWSVSAGAPVGDAVNGGSSGRHISQLLLSTRQVRPSQHASVSFSHPVQRSRHCSSCGGPSSSQKTPSWWLHVAQES